MALLTPELNENENQNLPIGVDRNSAVLHTCIVDTDSHQNPITMQPMSKRMKFTAPKLSASSRAVSPRTKILTERNIASSSCGSNSSDSGPRKSNLEETGRSHDTHDLTKTKNNSSGTPYVTPAYSWEIDPSSAKPYDPVTNYLVPRPKYLRYIPDRRLQVLLARERRLKTEFASSFDSKKVEDGKPSSDDSSSSSSWDSGSDQSPITCAPKAQIRHGGEEKSIMSIGREEIVTDSRKVEEIGKPSSDNTFCSLNNPITEDIMNLESKEIRAVSMDSQEVELEGKPSSDNTLGSSISNAPVSKNEMVSGSKQINSKSEIVSMHSQKVEDEKQWFDKTLGNSDTSGSRGARLDSESVEVNEEVDEEEEVKGGNGGWRWALLKIFLVFAVWGLSTAYISTMNSSSPLPVLRVARGMRNEFQQVEGRIVNAICGVENFGDEDGSEVVKFQLNSELIDGGEEDVVVKQKENEGVKDHDEIPQDEINEAEDSFDEKIVGNEEIIIEQLAADIEYSGEAQKSVAVDGSHEAGTFTDVAPDFEDDDGDEKSVAVNHADNGFDAIDDGPLKEEVLLHSDVKQNQVIEESDVEIDHGSSCVDVALDIHDDDIEKENLENRVGSVNFDLFADEFALANDTNSETKSDLLRGSEGQVFQKPSSAGISRIQDNGLETDQLSDESDITKEPVTGFKSDLQFSSDDEEIYVINDRTKEEFINLLKEVRAGEIKHHSKVELKHSWYRSITNNKLIWLIIGFLMVTTLGLSLSLRFYLSCKAASARSYNSRSKKSIKLHNPYEDRSPMKTPPPLEMARNSSSSYKSLSLLPTREKTESQNTYTAALRSGVSSEVRLVSEIELGDVSGGSLIRSSYTAFAGTPAVRDKPWERKGKEEKQRVTVSSRSLISDEEHSVDSVLSSRSSASASSESFRTREKILKKEEERLGTTASLTITPVRRSTRLRNREAKSP